MTTTVNPIRIRPTRFGRLLALTLAMVVATFSLLAGATPAGAHAGNQSYLYLDLTRTALGGRIEAPLKDIETALGLESLSGLPDDELLAGLEQNQDDLYRYFDEHLDLGADGVDYPITFTATELFYSDLPEADDNYIIFRFTADVGGGEVPREIDVRFDPFFDEIEGRDALLLIGNDWEGGVIENGHEVSSTFDDSSRTQTIDLGDTGWTKTFLSSAKLGINHIRTGPDHILFVLVLLLPSVLVFSAAWHPTPSFGSSLWRVMKVVTMFTVAHSITFTLAGLDILPLPSPKIVESIIAISIAAAAIHNLRPIAPNKEWLIAFSFGLFHGMGFASLVEGLDVPRSTQLVSLLGRNAGIEVGQSLVVLLLFPGLFLLRRTRYFKGFFSVLSVLLALISVGWMIERLFETELGVSAWVEPVVAFPRVLIYVALFTAVAAALNWFERDKDRLLPVFDNTAVPEVKVPSGV